jgi:hypothetical protein
MKINGRSLWFASGCAALIISAMLYAPVFTGKIPFPSDFVFDFPVYASAMPSYVSTVQTNIGDLVTSFYPYRTLAARAAREWTLPLWNPYMLSGTPFLAMAQSALFYPPNFLYYFLPVPLAWTIGFFLRRLLAVVFTALFLRRIGATQAGATGAGLLFGFCGFLTAWQGQAMSDAAIWLPLICYAVVRLHDQPDARSIGIAALAFSMPVLAGHPETAAHLTLTGTAVAAFLLVRRPRLAFIGAFAASGVLALALAAVQILPTVEWLQYIHHSLKAWPPPPLWSIVAMVSRDIIRTKTTAGLLMPEHAAYLAMLTFAVAPIGLLRRSTRGFAIFFAILTAAAFSAAYGIGPGHWIVQSLPVLSTLKNSRLTLVVGFGLSVLSGFGISALEERRENESQAWTWAVVLLSSAGCGFAFVLIYLIHRVPAQEIIEFVRMPRFGLYLLFASLLLVCLRLAGHLSSRWFASLALVLIAVDLTTVSYGAIPFTRPRDVFPRIELFERLPKIQAQPFRIAQIHYAYGANFELIYGYASVGGYELALERIKTFLKDVSRGETEMDSMMFTTSGALESRDRRIDMLNTKYFIVSEWDSRYLEFREQPQRFRFLYTSHDTDVYENLKALPRAYLVRTAEAEVISDEARQLQRVKDPDFDPEHRVVLSERPSQAPQSEKAPVIRTPRVEWRTQGVNSFEMDVNPVVPSVLIVSQMDYPGWKAYVDGASVPITRADYAFPAIFVDPGLHRVRFSFEPWTFKLGLTLTVAALVVIAGIVARSLRIRFRQRGQQSPGFGVLPAERR